MHNSSPISLATIVTELQRVCQEKLSGTINILTENRQLARISLLDGNIVALFCMSKRGAEALPLIRQLNPNWFQFIKGNSVTADSIYPQPPTSLIFLPVPLLLPQNRNRKRIHYGNTSPADSHSVERNAE